ncbi:MAG: YiaA/YiaB family inner membrane protein [Hyphomicrobiaceae bacterium]|nr:YiaA/YiaB family inner membrane protein [Hyphomicrobiaceae bacterium]
MPTPSHLATPAANAWNTGAWLSFTYAQFGVAAFMAGLGIWFLPVDTMVKGYMLMSNVFLVGAAFTLAKTVRDEHEAKRFANRIEEARTEKLLMEVGRVS